MIDACSAPASHYPDSPRTDRPDSACHWCGSGRDVARYGDQPRCGTCREHEDVIAAARRFIGMYGLRPLGGSTVSDDDEELAHRVAARAARAELDSTRLPEPARPARARTRTAAPPTAPAARSTKRSVTTTVDPDAAAQRVATLLTQLTTIDSELDDLDGAPGLPARARCSDLQRQRSNVLSTLAALEKARRSGR